VDNHQDLLDNQESSGTARNKSAINRQLRGDELMQPSWWMAAVLTLALTMSASGQTIRLKEIRLERVDVSPNLMPNYSFEEMRSNGIPFGWEWSPRNTDATCTVDESTAHSGRNALKLTNGTPYGAHIYGMLWRSSPILLKAGKAYTLSAWVKSEDAGVAWIGGGSNWQFRLQLPATAGGWRRVWMTFVPGEVDADFVMRIVIEAPTKGVWIDDIKLEEGSEPTPVEPAGSDTLPELQLAPVVPETEMEGDGVFGLTFLLFVPHGITDGMIEAMLDQPPQTKGKRLTLARGAWRIILSGEAVGAGDIPHMITLRLQEGAQKLAHTQAVMRFFSAANAGKRLSALRQALPSLKRMLNAIKAKGQDTACPMVTYTVLENFIQYAQEDLDYRTPEGWKWWVSGADARFRLDDQIAHSGRYAVLLTNRTPERPNVYGSLELSQPVRLQPDKPYTLSAWIRSQDPGGAWMGGGSGWQFRCPLVPTDNQWRQIALTFIPRQEDIDFVARLNTDSPTRGIWVDDVALVEGGRPDPSLPNLLPNSSFEQMHVEVRRALMQISDMEKMAARLRQELDEAKGGQRRFPAVPRWTGKERSRIEGPAFIGPALLPGSGQSPVSRPIFFTGYGAFGQVRADIEKFPRYGINIIQVEFGPNSVFPKEGQVSDAPIRETLKLLNRAKKAGVAVNLLISPHYFPGWMLDKYPYLRKRRDGFLQYCLHAPEGQELLKRFIKIIMPSLKDHPALHSICLSNEPVNLEEPCEYARRAWHIWLRQKHGDITTLNERWGSQHATFEEIPLPNPFALPPDVQDSPLWMEFVRFNQEWFARWHAMMADTIHTIAPDLPVHAKGMTWTFLNDGDVRYGVDAELFARFSQINGNDSVNFYSHGGAEFAQGWQMNVMGHDLQRSAKDAPVFNSENHLIPDRDTRYVPPEHIRSVLWQAAVHGQSATTIWVWERTYDPRSDFAGSIMHRPACVEAAGLVNHDLNRVSEEMTAIQKIKPQVVLLQSPSAAVWDRGSYTDCLGKLYAALAFTGLKIGFVTERQLEAGKLPEAPLLFVPDIVHLSDAAFEGLKRYTGRLVLVGGDDLLSRNDYNRERSEKVQGERLPYRYGQGAWLILWQSLLPRLEEWKVLPDIQLRDSQGQPLWGVEWLTARTERGKIVNLCNYRSKAMEVVLSQGGKQVEAADLLTGERVAGAITLQPLEVRLLLVERQ